MTQYLIVFYSSNGEELHRVSCSAKDDQAAVLEAARMANKVLRAKLKRKQPDGLEAGDIIKITPESMTTYTGEIIAVVPKLVWRVLNGPSDKL